MKYHKYWTKKFFVCGAVTVINLLTSNPANAANFKIGNVKRTFPTDAFCNSYNPKNPDKSILVDLDKSIWININGKDIELKSLSFKRINRKHSISKYRGQGFTVTIDRTLLRENDGALPTWENKDKITIQNGNTAKVLQLNSHCS